MGFIKRPCWRLTNEVIMECVNAYFLFFKTGGRGGKFFFFPPFPYGKERDIVCRVRKLDQVLQISFVQK